MTGFLYMLLSICLPSGQSDAILTGFLYMLISICLSTFLWLCSHCTGICSVSKVAPVHCEQELMSCCGAEIVPKRSQCEQQPYPLCNLQRFLLIWKDNLSKRGSVAISAPIKVFSLDSDRFKNLSDTKRSTFNSGAEQYCSKQKLLRKQHYYPIHFLRRSVSLGGTVWT